MNILQISHCFPPESMTGSEIYACSLAKELSKKHSVSVFYRINNPKEQEYKVTSGKYEGFDVYKINNTLKGYRSIERIYRNKSVEEKFVQVLNEVRPEIVHIHHLLFLSIGIIDEVKKRNIPIIFTLHDYWLACPRGQLLKYNLQLCKDPLTANCLFCLGRALSFKNLIKRMFNFRIRDCIPKKDYFGLKDILRKVDLFIAPSRFLRNKFIEFGVSPQKIVYCDNGMDLSLFADNEKTGSSRIRFGFIGTFIPSKGLHILIKAFNRIRAGKATLRIYGKSPMNNGIFNYYHKIKIMTRRNKNIRFMGAFDKSEVSKIFKEIDVLVFPSLWEENSPLVLHEAMLTGTPVIVSDIGGVSELVKNGKDGLFFDAGDVDSLYCKMKMFAEDRNILRKFDFNSTIIKGIKENSVELEKIYQDLSSSGEDVKCLLAV
ncbi:MAG: glycosyltransferase family 4 protein [Candidatus Gorgyraea atricola]|nr:glycosyltransferase family 4 protein [Candidatus Gorgyraea atricola]